MAQGKTKTYKVISSYEVDEKTLKQAVSAADAVVKATEKLGQVEVEAGRKSAQYADALQDVANKQRSLASVGKTISDSIDDQERHLKDAARAADAYGDAYRRASQDVEQFGDVATNISQVSGLLRGVGLGGIADIAMVGADVSDAVEGIRRLQPALQGVGQTVADIIPGISSATGGLAALGAAGIAVGVAAAAGAVALEAWKTANDEIVEGVENWIAATNEYNQSGPANAQAAQESVDAWNDQISENQKRIDLLRESYEHYTNGMGVLTRVYDNMLNLGGIKSMREEMERLEDANAQLNIQIAEARTEFGSVVDVTKTLISAEGALEAKRREQAQSAETLAAAQADYLAEQESVAQRSRDAAFSALDAERDRINLYRELNSILDTSGQEASLTDASEKRIAGLTATFDKFVASAEKKIISINQKLAADLAANDRNYMAESLKATEAYYQQERKLEDTHNRERLRIIRDMNNDLLSAEEDNDVIAFIRAQRAGEERLSQLDEEAQAEAKQRSQDFQAEQKERRIEYQQRIIDLKAAAAEEINTQRESISEKRDLLEQQIAEERAALTQQINDTRTAARIQVEARRAQFAQELRDLESYNRQRLIIEQNYAKQVAAAARAAATYTPPTYKTTSTKTSSSPYSTPYSSTSKSSVSIGSITVGSDVSKSWISSALQNAFSGYQNAVAKAYK